MLNCHRVSELKQFRLKHDMYVEIMHFLKLEIEVNNITTVILVIKLKYPSI